MTEKRILALDPGWTIGVALIDYVPYDNKLARPQLIQAYNVELQMTEKKDAFIWEEVSASLSGLIDSFEPDVIVMEDYRIYPKMAMEHIGNRLLVSELIGAICQEAAVGLIPVVRLMAGVKGNWPIARLKSRFPEYKQAVATPPHSRDALLLGLYYIEKRLGWLPTKQ